jgi:hypothetical protein
VCKLRTPGVEPGSQAWGACMMPLHYVRCHLLFCLFVVLVLRWLYFLFVVMVLLFVVLWVVVVVVFGVCAAILRL